MLEIKKELTGNKIADAMITDEIRERLIEIVSSELVDIKRGKYVFGSDIFSMIVFPPEYPRELCVKKLEELRDNLVSTTNDKMDTICKYVLYNMIALNCLSLKYLCGVTRVPFAQRDKINRILFDSFGTLKDEKKFLTYYEDYDNYPIIIFDDLEFTYVEDLTREELLDIEAFEKSR